MRIKYLVLMFWSSLSLANAQEVWNFNKCVQYALEHNINVKQTELSLENKKLMEAQAKNNRLPSLNANLSEYLNFGKTLGPDNVYYDINSSSLSGSLNASMIIWNNSRMSKLLEQQALAVQADEALLQKVQNDISLNVASVFLDVVLAGKLLEVAKEQIEITKAQLAQTQTLIDGGKVAESKIYEIQAQLASEELEIVSRANNLRLTYLSLYQILNVEDGVSFKIEVPDFSKLMILEPEQSNSIYNSALTFLPEIKQAQIDIEVAKQDIKISRSGRFPSLGLGASYNNQYNDYSGANTTKLNLAEQLRSNQRYGFGVQLSIPIFNQFNYRTQMRQAEINVKNQELNLENQKLGLRNTIDRARLDAKAAFDTYKANQRALEAFKKNFGFMQERFNMQLVTAVEYNTSKNQVQQAESRVQQAKYQYIFRLKILDFYKGLAVEL
ncbi:MAG: TolC family protein [Bacteroidales bacterium]